MIRKNSDVLDGEQKRNSRGAEERLTGQRKFKENPLRVFQEGCRGKTKYEQCS